MNSAVLLPPDPLPKAAERWTARFNVPVEFGSGSLDKLTTCLGDARRALLVTGQHAMKAAGVTERICNLLEASGVKSCVFSGLSAEPNHQEITQAAEIARATDAQVIIGCGGGSALDGAKAVAVAATHPGPIMEYVLNGPRTITAATLPVIAISSTSGTGSHVGRVSVLSDRGLKLKRALISDFIYPRVAICDPLILQTMTPEITAVTGFDAFAQALEGYFSRSEHPLGNLCAQRAMALIFPTLPATIEDGGDLDLRTAMAWGDTLAGISLATNAIITPHVFSMVLGARYGITHGRAIAAVTVACLRHSRPAAIAKLARLAPAFGANKSGKDELLADWAIAAIQEWIASIGLNRTLTEYGVPEQDFPSIAHEMRSAFALRLDADPLPPSESDLLKILHECV